MIRHPLLRKSATVLLAAVFVASVAACSDLPSYVTSCSPAAKSGNASDAVTASGAFGQNPEAHIPTPLLTKTRQIRAISTGKGPLLGVDDVAIVQSTIYSGDTGKILASTGSTAGFDPAKAVTLTVGQKAEPIGGALTCQHVGSRVATVMTAKQYFGKTPDASSGLTSNAPLVVITDITKGFRGRATGPLQPLQSGFPSVVTAPDGTPGITFDLQTAPKTLQVETVRKGSGKTVKKGDSVLLQIQGVEWSNPVPTDTFTSTWTDHKPLLTTIEAKGTDATSTATLDPGSVKALVGATVGSQLLVVVPPSAGYAKGVTPPDGYPTGSTLVFVYDILGIE